MEKFCIIKSAHPTRRVGNKKVVEKSSGDSNSPYIKK